MKRLCLAVAAVWCFCLAATAQNQIQVTWSFTNYFGATAPVSRLTIRPLQPFQIVSNNYIVPNTITFTPATYPSITNGSITTNVFTGSLYVATASGPGWTVTKTNYFPIQLTNGGPAYSASTYDVAGFATYNNVLTGIFFTGTNFITGGGTNIVSGAYVANTNGQATNLTIYSGVMSQGLITNLYVLNNSTVGGVLTVNNVYWSNSPVAAGSGISVSTTGGVSTVSATGSGGGSGNGFPLTNNANGVFAITNLAGIIVGGLASGGSNVIGTNFFAQVSNNIVLFGVTNGVLYVSQPILAQIMATNYPLIASSGLSSNSFSASGQSNIVAGALVFGISGGSVYFPVNTSKTNFTLAAGLASGAEHIVPGPSNQWTVEWDAATNIYWYGGMTRMKDTNGVWINAFDSRGGLGVGTTNYQGPGNIYASNNITASNSITAVRGTITGNGIGITNIQNAYTATNLNNALVTTGNGLMVRDVDGSSMGITGGGITIVYNPASDVPPFVVNNYATDLPFFTIDAFGNIVALGASGTNTSTGGGWGWQMTTNGTLNLYSNFVMIATITNGYFYGQGMILSNALIANLVVTNNSLLIASKNSTNNIGTNGSTRTLVGNTAPLMTFMDSNTIVGVVTNCFGTGYVAPEWTAASSSTIVWSNQGWPFPPAVGTNNSLFVELPMHGVSANGSVNWHTMTNIEVQFTNNGSSYGVLSSNWSDVVAAVVLPFGGHNSPTAINAYCSSVGQAIYITPAQSTVTRTFIPNIVWDAQ